MKQPPFLYHFDLLIINCLINAVFINYGKSYINLRQDLQQPFTYILNNSRTFVNKSCIDLDQRSTCG